MKVSLVMSFHNSLFFSRLILLFTTFFLSDKNFLAKNFIFLSRVMEIFCYQNSNLKFSSIRLKIEINSASRKLFQLSFEENFEAWKMKILIFLLIFMASAISIEIECRFKTSYWWPIGEIYYCDLLLKSSASTWLKIQTKTWKQLLSAAMFVQVIISKSIRKTFWSFSKIDRI